MAIGSVIASNDILAAFSRLKQALIATSSIIYTQKAGYFAVLGKTIQLYSIPEVISEVKTGVTGIHVLRPPVPPALSTDRKLVSCALKNRMAMISEDRGILTAMQRADAPYYNALMMLNFLLYSQAIDDGGYQNYLDALRKIARYSDNVWEFGRQLHAEICSKRHSGAPL